MIYIVELKTKVEGMRVTQCNEFRDKYKLEERIKKWIYEVRKDYGYREMVIECVTVNNEDVTDKMKED
jgi:hypothetical protein